MDRIPDYFTRENIDSEEKVEILVVDDEEGICLLLNDILTECGYNVTYFTKSKEALNLFKKKSFPVVLTDIKMPEIDGTQFLKEIILLNKNISVIMLTAYGSIENAVKCMELGAFNYITKPFKADEITAAVRKAIERVQLIQENISLKKKLTTLSNDFQIIGKSGRMVETLDFAKKIAQTNFKVLITGESGTGKELFARYLHDFSARANGPYIPVQCSLLPETLLESELFGHKKGAFTGAVQDKKGLFEEADHGTLFLDEIGDINPNIQGKLLRFLEEKEIKRIGDVKSRIVDVRVVFATNKDLQKLVNENLFRDDLYFRIKEIEIKIPPLRERKEDIPLLIRYFLNQISEEMNRKIDLDKKSIELFLSYTWPGNIRELKNTLAGSAAFCENNIITKQDVERILTLKPEHNNGYNTAMSFSDMRKKIVADFDRKHITASLIQTKGNITKTAIELKLDKKNLWMMLKKYGIDHKSFKDAVKED